MKKYGFVYIWYDKKHKRFYIGSHWGNETDGYICSSRWMRKAFKRRPEDFKRKIVCLCSNKKLLLEEEQRWLSMINPKLSGIKYYNISMSVKNPWWNQEENIQKTVGQKISESHKANPNWGVWAKGKEVSQETREKLRQHNLGNKHTEETKQKCRSYKHTPEAIQKIIEAGKRPSSEEKKQKLREKHKGKSYHKLSKEAKEKVGLVSKGSKWINNGMINMRIKETNIPEGFEYGRI